MSDRTRRLYIILPLLWILVLAATIGMARMRTPGAALTHRHTRSAQPSDQDRPSPGHDHKEDSEHEHNGAALRTVPPSAMPRDEIAAAESGLFRTPRIAPSDHSEPARGKPAALA